MRRSRCNLLVPAAGGSRPTLDASRDVQRRELGLPVQDDPPRVARPVAGGSRPTIDAYRAMQRRELGLPVRPRLDPPPRYR